MEPQPYHCPLSTLSKSRLHCHRYFSRTRQLFIGTSYLLVYLLHNATHFLGSCTEYCVSYAIQPASALHSHSYGRPLLWHLLCWSRLHLYLKRCVVQTVRLYLSLSWRNGWRLSLDEDYPGRYVLLKFDHKIADVGLLEGGKIRLWALQLNAPKTVICWYWFVARRLLQVRRS